ncbi:DUF4129 domain-containing protein [Leptolyngbya sp. 7M]|uniref:DUF4129 domain-containing protein n=1 Tax=Leptolyngbya sp. 7M TaxID=2812896 RepID=UPI001B8C1789|nr:DUF4129 domain-containing protein [Leptolyngbya sp. 7M]QYO65757.1 DUF4129 domain-containing protein [Leptolyngbya sp. 7M]
MPLLILGSESRTKDEDKQKLAEILSREEFQRPPASENSLLEEWMKRLDEWLARLFPVPSGAGGTAPSARMVSAMQILILIGIVALVGFGLYKLLPLLFPGLKRSRAERPEGRVVLGEVIAPEVPTATIFDEAERLAQSGHTREAIRKGYIALLCELADRRVIGLSRNKTNRDYLRDARRNTTLYPHLAGITGKFELHWYGNVACDSIDWRDFRESYQEALRSI